jgi:hypothetical protein
MAIGVSVGRNVKRVLLITRNQHPLPQEAAMSLFQGFAAWRAKYKGQMEAFFFFAGAAGGGGILNVADEAALNQMMVEWPLSPFSTCEFTPIVDGDIALQQYIEAIQAMMAGQQ